MPPSVGSIMAKCGLTRADLRARVTAVLPALLLASFDPTAFAQAESSKPVTAPVVDKEKLFPGNRGAQRMMNAPRERLSLAGFLEDQTPDWAEWWSVEEVMLGLGIPKERAAAVEALLEVRKQARIDAIKASETSEAGVKFVEAARAAEADEPAAMPPLEVRAKIARLGARAALPAFDAIKEADRGLADACARLVLPGTQPEPDDATLERMRLGVGRLRGFDPALSRMKVLNTGVELTIHAAPLLGQAGESRQAIAAEIAAWQQAVAPLLDALERHRAEIVAASASDQPFEQRVRRLGGAEELRRSAHADLVASNVRSARNIAAIIAASDPDRANAWLRSVYRAVSPANLGATSGDAALDEAARIVLESGDQGREWSGALTAIRSESLRASAELEGALVEACISAVRNRDRSRELMTETGPVFKINERRVAQSEVVVERIGRVLPIETRTRVRRAAMVARARTVQFIPTP